MKLNGENNLGYILLAVMYFSISIFSPFSSTILKRFGIKTCLFVGGFGHFLLLIASALPAWKQEYFGQGGEKGNFEIILSSDVTVLSCVIVAAMANGFGASILWVA